MLRGKLAELEQEKITTAANCEALLQAMSREITAIKLRPLIDTDQSVIQSLALDFQGAMTRYKLLLMQTDKINKELNG
jgi:hypothetical protein